METKVPVNKHIFRIRERIGTRSGNPRSVNDMGLGKELDFLNLVF